MLGKYNGYDPLLREIIRFFQTGNAPVTSEESTEIYAFMAAAEESKIRGGEVVVIEEVLDKSKAEAAVILSEIK